MSSPAEIAQLATAAKHLEAAKYYDIAAFVMLLYDTLITIPTEVEKIWKKNWTGLTLLWFLNRWIFILAVIPTIVAFHDPAFVGIVMYFSCQRFFRYAGYIATFQRVVIGSVFILRTYCIYSRSLKAAALIGVFLIAEIVLKLFADLKWGAAVVLPKGFVACVLAVSPGNANKFMLFWVSELCTDTVVLGLTMYRSYVVFKMASGFSHSRLWHIIVKDGLMYFFIMFAANLTTVIFDLTAAQDLKAINANFGVMINSLMTARLILNLKAVSSTSEAEQPHYTGFNGARTTLEANILGNIGNEFEDNLDIASASSGATLVSQSGRTFTGNGKNGSIDYGGEYELTVRRSQGNIIP